VVEAIHVDQIREHGGLIGLRDENAPESALARPRQKWTYEPQSDLPALAAAYAYGLSSNHPFRDGNKRLNFVAAVVFLRLNGVSFDAPQDEVVEKSMALAAGELSELDLADWIRSRSRPSG
jgi:death-on-curing protein